MFIRNKEIIECLYVLLGFGTLIRAMGTQINKGARKGACRDLSGRRMRDVDAEKKYVIRTKWCISNSVTMV